MKPQIHRYAQLLVSLCLVTLYLTKQLSEEAQRAGVRGACAKTDLDSVVDAVGALLREETYFPA